MRKHKKLAALTFLLIHAIVVFYPGTTYALTSGPSAPESSQFQAASITNLVDPFSGDFSYNIPLLDVDGYPINIAYNSGGSMDDEASWVGYGWNINSGSVSRIMKGIPDDFNGTDMIKKEYNVKPDITGGVSFNGSMEIFGLDFLGANGSVDIFYNNHRGLGVELGAGISATLSGAKHVAGEYTYGLSAGANLGITSNSQTGADFNFGANLGISAKNKDNESGALGLRFGGSLNSRAGMKSTTLGASFNTSKSETDDEKTARLEEQGENMENAKLDDFKTLSGGSSSASLGSATTSYGMAFNPTISMPMKNQSFSLAPQAGLEFWGFQFPVQLTGHFTKQELATHSKDFPAFGFLHASKGRINPNAIMDFNREKDVPYMENTPTLSVPYVTQDVFTATSHLGSSQFKAFSNSSGVFFDSYSANTSEALSLGIEFGAGGGIKGGADISGSGSSTVTRKWISNNDFLHNGDFSKGNAPDGEATYFKLVGEKSSINKDFLTRIAGGENVKVRTDEVSDQAKAFSTLVSNNNSYPVSSKIARNKREVRGELFTPLVAEQAQYFALDKYIYSYPLTGLTTEVACDGGMFAGYSYIERKGEHRKANHISEVSVTKIDGTRLLYGVPVYNKVQHDVTFNNENAPASADNSLVQYDPNDNSVNNNEGTDHYYSKETVPSYATSFLLSGVCSPDYRDLTGNGISDDDLGNAVRFNYTLANANYQWRSPNARNGINYANFNTGNRSDNEDNKASISYGTKEIWYQQSIESKNMIAVFRLEDRRDGFGYHPNGTIDNNSYQKKLKRIDLYTKAELKNNPGNPTPVKSVHFDYDYSLFNNVPNNVDGQGKLTLKSIYFTYGKNLTGHNNRYYFNYNESGDYQYQQYDRWGTYKDKSSNSSVAGIHLDNNDFPYSIQNQFTADEAVKKWQLKEIILPSGGKINVEYESDDYAFVQDRRAMQMTKIEGFNAPGSFTGYQTSNKVHVKLPAPSTNEKFKSEYFEGMDQLYFKVMVDVDNANHNEFVSGYAKITGLTLVSSDIVRVDLEPRGGYHPIAAAAWQHLRTNLPKLAYPYSVSDDLGPLALIRALVAAIRNIAELVTPFEQKAIRQGFGSEIIEGESFARIVNNYRKFGGGLRVKRIIMDDIWDDMSSGSSTRTGMEFDYNKDYKTATGDNISISSGVASYEPMSGSEENPFKQPITYQQKAHLTSSVYTVEEPLGESYFPGASVGYSQVKIINLDAESQKAENGYTIKKFYTARDFPTKVKRTDLSKKKYNQSSIFGLFDIDQGNSVVLSQGFLVENNDMHGKPLSDENVDGKGKVISGTYYHYKTSGSERMELDNNALTLQHDGTVRNEMIAQEFEMYHDMREQITDNTGVNLNINLDVLYFALFVIPIPTFIPIVQSTYSGYQASSTIKIINKYCVADKVTIMENGSTVQKENMLWDAATGQVLLTKTQNGFDDPVYDFSLPAYLVDEYEQGMGGGYKNTGILFPSVDVQNGVIPAEFIPYLVPGDELGILESYNKLWVMKTSNGELRLINEVGKMQDGKVDLLLLRSGRRNLMGTNSYSIVSLKSPIRNGKISIDRATDVLSTSAQSYSDEWNMGAFNPKKEGQTKCHYPVDEIVNPYCWGLKGNWLSKENFVYSINRDPRIDPINQALLATNVRKGGIFESFTSFYGLVNNKFKRYYPGDPEWDDKWIATSTVTKINGKGLEVENVNPLNQYSSAQYGFNDLLATAVCNNARINEIGFDGFEDYKVSNTACQNSTYNCNQGHHFDFQPLSFPFLNGDLGEGEIELTEDYAHTGNFSVKVRSGESPYILKEVRSVINDVPKYIFNTNHEMLLQEGGTTADFGPFINKKYVLTGWIKGDVANATDPLDPSKSHIKIEHHNTSYEAIAVKAGPKVEGWTRVMTVFEISEANGNLRITLSAGQGNDGVYFDDIRIHPYNANMKSFVYDYKTMRLMAELDENNYATFYEYNDQGQLLRSKKETEKGIITLKETRSHLTANRP